MSRHHWRLIVGTVLMLALSIGALWAAMALAKCHLLMLGFIVGLLTVKAKDGFPWPRVAHTVGQGLLLCCAALFVLQQFSARSFQDSVSPQARTSAPLPSQSASAASAASAASPLPAVPEEPNAGVNPLTLKSLQDQLKDLKEGINQTVTIWSVLLAALAVVLSFVTSWVIGIAKDAKDQMNQLGESARLQDRLKSVQREALRQANLLEINRQLELIANDELGTVQRQFLLQVRRALIATPELHDPFSLPHTMLGMERSLLAAQTIANNGHDLWNSPVLRNLRERVVEWLAAEHQIVQDLPHLRGAEGVAILALLRGWVRLLR